MSGDYVSRRSQVARRADKAPLEGRTLAKDYPRNGRLHYPHYSTMYVHEPGDPQKRRHETIRNIYLWNVPAEKRADKPKTDATRQKHFETKYRSLLKDRADHEWSRKYYYPRDEYAKGPPASSSQCDRCGADEENQRLSKRPSTYEASSGYVYSTAYTRRSTYESKTPVVEEKPERARPSREVREIPSLASSKSVRRMDRYLSSTESSTASSSRPARATRASREAIESVTEIPVATSSSSGARSHSRLSSTNNDVETEAPAKPARHSRVSSSSSSASSASSSADVSPAEHQVVDSIQPAEVLEPIESPKEVETAPQEEEQIEEQFVEPIEPFVAETENFDAEVVAAPETEEVLASEEADVTVSTDEVADVAVAVASGDDAVADVVEPASE